VRGSVKRKRVLKEGEKRPRGGVKTYCRLCHRDGGNCERQGKAAFQPTIKKKKKKSKGAGPWLTPFGAGKAGEGEKRPAGFETVRNRKKRGTVGTNPVTEEPRVEKESTSRRVKGGQAYSI